MYSKVIENKLAKHNIHLGSFVDEGSYGTVYDLKDQPDKVIKITSDDTEARAMNIIKSHPQKNIVNVDRVFCLKDIANTYFIIQEKLEGLDSADNAFFNSNMGKIIRKYKLSDKIDFDNIRDENRNVLRNYGGVLELYIEILFIKFYRKEIPERYKNSEIMKFINSIIDSNIQPGSDIAHDLLEAYWQLKSVNIDFDDAHTGNIMKKGNIYKLIDLGASRSPRQTLDVLEIKNIIKEIFLLEKSKIPKAIKKTARDIRAYVNEKHPEMSKEEKDAYVKGVLHKIGWHLPD